MKYRLFFFNEKTSKKHEAYPCTQCPIAENIKCKTKSRFAAGEKKQILKKASAVWLILIRDCVPAFLQYSQPGALYVVKMMIGEVYIRT